LDAGEPLLPWFKIRDQSLRELLHPCFEVLISSRWRFSFDLSRHRSVRFLLLPLVDIHIESYQGVFLQPLSTQLCLFESVMSPYYVIASRMRLALSDVLSSAICKYNNARCFVRPQED
jgi:hypothetical protein